MVRIISSYGTSFARAKEFQNEPVADLIHISVVARATASPPDANALKAMGIHYKFLMRVAQTLCVITQAKGVLLAGDNQVSL